MHTIVIIFSANSEWRAARKICRVTFVEPTPFGECFAIREETRSVIYMQGGWGKISAAASTQYAISHWHPDLVVNLGTCGGFEGKVARGEIILADRTLVYDLIEQMGDQQAALEHYTVKLNLSWLAEPYPQAVRKGLLLSADRDILPEQVGWLQDTFGGIAADWESGAIAWVCQQNHVKCLILRAVSDLVNGDGGEAYGDIGVFHQATEQIIADLLTHLPEWLEQVDFS
jgi:adenosylhomocysteine nucleosidase